MIKLYLCDDRTEDLARYRTALHRLAKKHKIALSITCFESGSALCFALEDVEKMPDLIYLDILMGKENGITTGALLRQYGCTSLIVYLTTSHEYAISSFATRPFYYLLKDSDDPGLFERVFLDAIAEIQKGREQSFTIKVERSYIRIPQKDIIYLEVYGHSTLVHTRNMVYHCRLPLDQAEIQLSEFPFIRVHRSYLVNPVYIAQIDRKSVTLISGDTIPMGKQYVDSTRKFISRYLFHDVAP